jgi:DNA-binding beta-propeller fold protein YncE
MRKPLVTVVCCVGALVCSAAMAWAGPISLSSGRPQGRVASTASGGHRLHAPLTIPTGNGPEAVAIDRRTHTVYVPNGDDGTVSVINPATCNAHTTTRCERMSPTITVGSGPTPAVVDEATDTIYVANSSDNTVSVINGAACNSHVHTGCDQTPPTINVGNSPYNMVLDSATHTLYTANFGDGTVSVVDTTNCSAHRHAGCGQTPTSVSFGNVQPNGLLLDGLTHTLYVADLTATATDAEPDTVNMLNTSTCSAEVTTGCAPVSASIPVGVSSDENNVGMALDGQSKTLYVTNATDTTMSLVNVAHCTATDTTGCAGHSRAVPTSGSASNYLLVEPRTHTLYELLSDDNTVSVVDSRSCNVHHAVGCRHPKGTLRASLDVQYLGLDAATRTLYVSNGDDLSVINAARCNAVVNGGCNAFPSSASVGYVPSGIAIDSLTHTAYVTNGADDTVSVINTLRCNALSPAKCRAAVPTVSVGVDPQGVAVDVATNTVYVTDVGSTTTSSDSVSVIDGATCDAAAMTGCDQTVQTITVGDEPYAIAVDADSHTAYVGNVADNTVSVINTATCNAHHSAGCSQTPATAPVGAGPNSIVLDAASHTAYIANENGNTISVMDIATCNATNTTDCDAPEPTVAAGSGPAVISLDRASGALYVSDQYARSVAVLDAGTCNAADISGCGQTPGMIAVGDNPYGTVLDKANHTLYVGNLQDNSVSEINTAICGLTLHASCRLEANSAVAGDGPSAIAFDSAVHTVYVANSGDADLSMLRVK